MKFSAVFLGVASAALLFGASAGAATIVQDGTFAGPPASGTYTTISTGGTIGGVGAWTVVDGENDPGQGSVDLIGTYWQPPPTGGQSVDLDGNHPGGITQTFTLAPGNYDLRFYLSGNPDGPPTEKSVTVSVGGTTKTYTYDYLTSGTHDPNNMNYVLENLDFASTGGATTLSFISGDPASEGDRVPAYGAVIGGVSVSVPEPATWTMLMLGIGGLGASLRRSRRPLPLAAPV